MGSGSGGGNNSADSLDGVGGDGVVLVGPGVSNLSNGVAGKGVANSGGGGGGWGGLRGFSGFPPGSGLRGRGSAGNVGPRGEGLQSRRPGMMSTPNLLVLPAQNAPASALDSGAATGGAGNPLGVRRTSLINPKSVATLSPIVSAAGSPVESPIGTGVGASSSTGLAGSSNSGGGGVSGGVGGEGTNTGVGSRGSGGGGVNPRSGVKPSLGGLHISPPKLRGAPSHQRNQHSWGGVVGVSAATGAGPTTAAAAGTGAAVWVGSTATATATATAAVAVSVSAVSVTSKSTSPLKQAASSGVGLGLHRMTSWPLQLAGSRDARGAGAGSSLDSFDSWV